VRLGRVLVWLVKGAHSFGFLQYLRFAVGNRIPEFEKSLERLIGARLLSDNGCIRLSSAARRFLRVRWNDLLAEFYPNLAASAAT
jgi:hypothetical protein